MAGTIKVIESKVQKLPNGKTASLYGSHVKGSVIETVGYTWEVVRGDGSVTIGLGRKPEKSRSEAIKIANEVAVKTGLIYIN